jgi:hypothetical protein
MYNNFSYFLININDKYEAEILLKQLALFVKISLLFTCFRLIDLWHI